MGLWMLHIIAIQGAAGWRTGLTLWLLVLLLGGGFAYLAGEWLQPDGLAANLLLAGAGAALANAVAAQIGGDILAFIFGVRVFWAATGSVLVLCLAHEAAGRLLQARGREQAALFGITGRGGITYLVTWLSGWPSEPGLVEGSYGDGLPAKLLPEALHYQVHAGPLRISRAIPLIDGLEATAEDETLVLSARPGSAAAASLRRALSLPGMQPPRQALLFATRIEQLSGRAEAIPRPESPPAR